jgi:hypothetical protein
MLQQMLNLFPKATSLGNGAPKHRLWHPQKNKRKKKNSEFEKIETNQPNINTNGKKKLIEILPK